MIHNEASAVNAAAKLHIHKGVPGAERHPIMPKIIAMVIMAMANLHDGLGACTRQLLFSKLIGQNELNINSIIQNFH